MKKTYFIIVLVLIIFAWPFYYLYQRQLGYIPFLLLAIFFFYLTWKKWKRLKRQDPTKDDEKEKIKQNSR